MQAFKHAGLTAALLMTTAIVWPVALTSAAQEAEGEEEVVVTARKRTETVSEAPATIAVVNPEKLKSLAITSANELNGVVPGLVVASGVGGLPGVTFRGLGSNSALFSVEASVALFVDGVYSAHTRDYVTPVYDLDRVEMVKGTQGTLLGKNTTLGAITMVTRRPRDEFGGFVSASYDFDTETPRLEAAIDIPIANTLHIRFSGLYVDDGGYVDNQFTGGVPQTQDLSGRMTAVWTPSEHTKVTFIYQHDDHDQTGQSLEVVRDASAGTTLAARALQIGQIGFEARGDRHNHDGSRAFGTAPAGLTPYDEQTSDRLNLIVDWDIGDNVLTSQTAYVDWAADRLSDLDFLQANLFNLADIEENSQFSQEFRLTSSSERSFRYLAGVYYFYNDWTLNRTIYGYAPSALFGTATSLYNQKTETFSVFGQVEYDILENLTASLGLRYTSETKDATLFRPVGSGSLNAAFPPYPESELTNKEEDIDGDIGLKYTFGEGRMIYASASKGSKGGGFQNSPTTVAGAPYSGETAYTYEVGAKFVFDRASLDVALFRTEVKDFQFSRTAVVGNPGVSQTVVTNIDVSSQGVELNGSVWLGESLRLSGGVVYADSIFDETVPLPPAIPVAVDGLQQPRAPKWSGNVDLNFMHELTEGYTIKVLGSLEFMSKTYYQPNVGNNLNAPFRDGFAKLNVRVALQSDEAGWEIALLGKNLTDVTEPQFVTSVSGTGAGGNTPAWYGIINPGPTVVLQFQMDW